MRLFWFEHSRLAYRADFALYGVALAGLALFLAVAGLRMQRTEIAVLALTGLAGWTLVEYLLHRFVLHRLRPFSTWHAEHHRRPGALICTPTLLSATLIAALVFLPALLFGDLWRACALTFGLLAGYLGYATVHHAMHHWRPDSAWLRRLKRVHALHHRTLAGAGHYGVTSAFWDRVFGTDARAGARADGKHDGR